MSTHLSLPLIQTLTPERWAGWSMDFITAGYTGLLVKNGRLIRKLSPGRHFSFALPWLERCELILVDSKLRNLEIVSQGDFLSRDQYLVNVSINVMYQVVDPKRVALELSDPLVALTSAIKDNLGMAVNQMRMDQLTQQGRAQIRQYLLDHVDTCYMLGFNLEDVRVSDINFPQTRGIIRQIEGMSARQEDEYEASLKMQIAGAGRSPQVQQVNITPSSIPGLPLPEASLEPTAFILQETASPPQTSPPQTSSVQDRPVVAPTVLASQTATTGARLVNRTSGAIASLSHSPFTIGREPNNHLVPGSALCSRHHALIIQVSDPQGAARYQLTDVGSSNGTFINGQRIPTQQPFWLGPGVVIRLGDEEWVFEGS